MLVPFGVTEHALDSVELRMFKKFYLLVVCGMLKHIALLDK